MKNLLLSKTINFFFEEDDVFKNFEYASKLPDDLVDCQLKIKDDLVLSGLPFMVEVFNHLKPGCLDYNDFKDYEAKFYQKQDKAQIHFQLPFNLVLTAERLALNLLQRSSAISTNAKKYTDRLRNKNVTILDTRKTTPGLRFLEKYAVLQGGGNNHRFNQSDVWMIKDNHKSFFGGLKKAMKYFQSIKSYYTPMVIEIHDLDELKEGMSLGGKNFMLDNFSPEQIQKAVELKKDGVHYEVSGGINLDNLNDYAIEGVDAISSGSLTYNAKHVGLSLKYKRA